MVLSRKQTTAIVDTGIHPADCWFRSMIESHMESLCITVRFFSQVIAEAFGVVQRWGISGCSLDHGAIAMDAVIGLGFSRFSILKWLRFAAEVLDLQEIAGALDIKPWGVGGSQQSRQQDHQGLKRFDEKGAGR